MTYSNNRYDVTLGKFVERLEEEGYEIEDGQVYVNEGDMMSTRLIMWDLSFTAKSYIFPPVKSGKYIRQANTNIFIDSQVKTAQTNIL